MGKTRNLKGIPGNLALSYLSTLGYYRDGYMADWLNYISQNKHIEVIEVDILNNKIIPEVCDIKPLKWNLKKLRGILEKELSNNGFEIEFIKKAVMKFEIPLNEPNFENIIYCYPYIQDENGKIYKPKKSIIDAAYMPDFNPTIYNRKSIVKPVFVKMNWITKIKEIWS